MSAPIPCETCNYFPCICAYLATARAARAERDDADQALQEMAARFRVVVGERDTARQMLGAIWLLCPARPPAGTEWTPVEAVRESLRVAREDAAALRERVARALAELDLVGASPGGHVHPAREWLREALATDGKDAHGK